MRFLRRVGKPLLCFINLEEKLERENLKRTIFANGGLGLLQMILEPDIG